jgi:hypothetical protein
VVGVVAAVLVGTLTLSGDDDGGGEAGEDGDGDLEVVEQGLSNYDANGEATSAFGLVVENTGDDTFNDAFVEVGCSPRATR